MIRLICWLLVAILLSGCSSAEESARELYNEALNYKKNNENEKAASILEKIVADYPGTEISVKANEELLLHSRIHNVLKNKTVDNYKKTIAASLDLYKLKNYQYPNSLEDVLDVSPNIPRKVLSQFEYSPSGGSYTLKHMDEK